MTFGLVWTNLPRREAEKLVGKIIETVVAEACEGKADNVWHDLGYGPARNRQQIEVAARSGSEGTLIEVKAKTLTREGQVGLSALPGVRIHPLRDDDRTARSRSMLSTRR